MARPSGPPPASRRRRANVPASYGLAEPVKGGVAGKPPALGFRAHKMVTSMWRALKGSVESQFYSQADWERARIEMWLLNRVLIGEVELTAANWQRVQAGLNDLLVSPADKRRAGIELTKEVDSDEDAAVSQIAGYHAALAS